jgi:hypothetical protein
MRPDQGTATGSPGPKPPPTLSRTHQILIGVVSIGAVVIAAIGFAGSYAAVRNLAEQKGFGDFAPFFPIGIDAGIIVLLALDLLLTWICIPFPMLRQTAWLLTAATIAFNGAAAWPDKLGVGMHAAIPVLFVVTVEAARHAVGRMASITADRHMEGVRVSRWLLAFPSTFRLWRRMKLWELRSYEQVIEMEQDRIIYEARLRARYGRGWRRKAPVEAMMPLRLARYGVPLAETGTAGLRAAGIKLERVDATTRRPSLPPVNVDQEQQDAGQDTEPHRRADEDSTVPGLETPEPGRPEQDSYEDEALRSDQLLPARAGTYAAAPADAARVQARLPVSGWAEPRPEEDAQSPIGDRPEAAPAPHSLQPSEEATAEAAPEPERTGVELLEDRYLQLPEDQRWPHQSASAIARSLHAGVGLTEGTARKYLRGIIDKHS